MADFVTNGGRRTIVITHITSFTFEGYLCCFANRTDAQNMNNAILHKQSTGVWPGYAINILINFVSPARVMDYDLGESFGVVDKKTIKSPANTKFQKRIFITVSCGLIFTTLTSIGIALKNVIPIIVP